MTSAGRSFHSSQVGIAKKTVSSCHDNERNDRALELIADSRLVRRKCDCPLYVNSVLIVQAACSRFSKTLEADEVVQLCVHISLLSRASRTHSLFDLAMDNLEMPNNTELQ